MTVTCVSDGGREGGLQDPLSRLCHLYRGEGLRWVNTLWAYPIMIAAVIPAHIIGRIKAAGVDDCTDAEPGKPSGEGEAADDGAAAPMIGNGLACHDQTPREHGLFAMSGED